MQATILAAQLQNLALDNQTRLSQIQNPRAVMGFDVGTDRFQNSTQFGYLRNQLDSASDGGIGSCRNRHNCGRFCRFSVTDWPT